MIITVSLLVLNALLNCATLCLFYLSYRERSRFQKMNHDARMEHMAMMRGAMQSAIGRLEEVPKVLN